MFLKDWSTKFYIIKIKSKKGLFMQKKIISDGEDSRNLLC